MSSNKKSICIIGSGPGGAVIAVLMAELGFSVTLLEKGSEDPEIATEDNYIANCKSKNLELRHAFQIGGTSNLWSGLIAKYRRKDFDEISACKDFFPSMENHYEFALETLGIKNHAAIFKDSIIKSNLIRHSLFGLKKNWRAKDYLHKKIKDRKLENLRIISNASVEKIIHVNGIAKSVVLHNRQESLNADIFILAAGGLGSPMLLLKSGYKNKNIGKNLSTHPKGKIASLKFKNLNGFNFILKNLSFKKRKDYYEKICFSNLDSNCENFHYVSISKKRFDFFKKIIDKSFKFSRDLSNPKLEPYLRMLNKFGIRLMFFAKSLDSIFSLFSKNYDVNLYMAQKHLSSNRIFFDKSFNLPRIDYKICKEDIDSAISLFDKVNSYFLQESVELTLKEDWIENLVLIHSHFLSTCRIGMHEKDGVVDSNLKLFESKNVFILDSSVFPCSGYQNPVLTIIALAKRLSEFLHQEFNAKS